MFSKSDGTIHVRLHSSWQQRATRLLEPSSPRYRLFPGDHQLERRGRRNQICNHPIIGTQYSACLQARRGCDPPVARCCGKSCSKGPVLAKYGHSSIHVRREQIGGPVFIHHALDDVDLDVVRARHGGDRVDVRGERGEQVNWCGDGLNVRVDVSSRLYMNVRIEVDQNEVCCIPVSA